MKGLYMLLFLMLLVGCQEEELTIVEEQQDIESAAALDAQLRGLVQSVASHDGSHDDIVDKSSCFSINFPYQVYFNGEPYQINSISDFAPFGEDDEIIPIFPITITYTDYESMEMTSENQFQAEVDKCNAQELFDDKVTCVDLVYPVRLAIYDADNTNFETVVLDHDRLTFVSLNDIPESVIVSLNYPVELVWENGAVVKLMDNEDLRSEILDAVAICN